MGLPDFISVQSDGGEALDNTVEVMEIVEDKIQESLIIHILFLI